MRVVEAIETVTLRDPVADVTATFAPGVGMVCCSLRHEGEELLAQNDGLEAYARTGATMGIPLLHPWANRLDGWSYTALGVAVDLEPARAIVPVEEHGLPIHGTLPRAFRAVASDWRLAAELAAGASAAFPFPHKSGSRPSWVPRRCASALRSCRRRGCRCRSRSGSTRTSCCPACRARTGGSSCP